MNKRAVIPELTLQPLSIPSGWEVVINKFYDIDPATLREKEIGADDPIWLYFESTLLLLRHSKRELDIDLGWGPEWDKEGKYYLTVHKMLDYTKSLFEIKSKSKKEIVNWINRLLTDVLLDDWKQQLQKI